MVKSSSMLVKNEEKRRREEYKMRLKWGEAHDLHT